MKFLRVKEEPTIFLFRKAFSHTGAYKKYFVSSLVLAAIGQIVLLLEPLIFAQIVNELQRNGVNPDNLGYLLLLISLMLGILILYWAFHFPSRLLERKNAFWVKKNYQMYLFDKVFSQSLAWHGDRDSGDTLDKVNNASSNLFTFCQDTFKIVGIFVKTIGTVVALAFFSIWISLGVALLTVISFYILYLFDKRMILDYKAMNVYGNKISAKVYDAISNVVTILILRITDVTSKSIDTSLMAPKNVWWQYVAFNEKKWFVGNMLFRSMIVVPLAYYLYISSQSATAFEIGTFSALYLYLANYSQVFFGFSSIYETLIAQKARIQNAEEIEASQETASKKRKVSFNNKLQITNLNFNYQSAEQSTVALKNVDFQILKGEKIACIGKSGSGKTTFLKVIHGLYNTSTSSITADDKKITGNLHEVDLYTTLVPQEPELFSSTILENITFGLDYSEEQIQKVLQLAEFSEVVSELPNGLYSRVNEKGVNLSGGQKQRLALARALLFAGDKEIILLDESTSSVDPTTEVKIYQGVFSEFTDKTFIANVHKLNLLKYFDKIVIFDKGEIVSVGTFDELVSTNTEFKVMWEDFVASQK
jgi:ABC-type multidrug transport system fused ATPase/permease subunit